MSAQPESSNAQPESPPAGEPLVSVIVPTFNRIQFLREALESAIGQTYRNLEIIVSDDGSKEDVLTSVIAPLGDSRIVYRRNPTTLGMGPNIWTAFRSSRGKYVATLHDDDAWEPDFLAALVPPLEADASVVVAFSDHHVVDSRGVVDVPLTDRSARLFSRDVLRTGRVPNLLEVAVIAGAVPSAMAALFRRSAIDWDDFPAEVGTYYDKWLNYLAARTGDAGYYDQRRLTRYRVHGSSETYAWTQLPGRLRALRQSEFIYRRFVADPALRSIRAFSEREYRKTVISLTLSLFEAGQPAEGRQVLASANEVGRSGIYEGLRAAAMLPAPILRRGTALLRRVRATLRQARARVRAQ
jgi:glycosyltransferase involved in cell wall biosynthesis